MKANEAPEKIYIHPDIGGREFLRPWLRRAANNESVEYTRTDAFIEKALKWLDRELVNDTDDFTGEHFINFMNWGHSKERFISHFKRAMKDE